MTKHSLGPRWWKKIGTWQQVPERLQLLHLCLNQSVSSVTQSCPTLCTPMDCSTPGFTVHYQLPELTQTQVHRVGDAIQSSHPLSSPSPPAFNLSQHQDLFNESILRIRWPKYYVCASEHPKSYFLISIL